MTACIAPVDFFERPTSNVLAVGAAAGEVSLLVVALSSSVDPTLLFYSPNGALLLCITLLRYCLLF